MADLLKPHTDEWFKAFEMVEPHHAKILREVIELAGHRDVCSMCGMHATTDCSIPGTEFQDGSPLTMRLCWACILSEKGEIIKTG